MKKQSVLYALCSMLCIGVADAATSFPTTGASASTPFSQYGMIQNVQNYSTNPNWNPNSPYNQRMPQPVYAKGADLTAADCQSVVAQLVSMHCGIKNNCSGMRLTDVKPDIMVQLSRLSGANYVSSCSGFIDSAFNQYMGNAVGVSGNARFPTAVNPGNNKPAAQFKIDNPYEVKMPSHYGDEWFQGIMERGTELQKLQSQNGGGTDKLAKATMPTTASDLSFQDRMANATSGYEQWAGASAYQQMNLESDEKRTLREMMMAQQNQQSQMHADQMNMTHDQFCKKYPNHESCPKKNGSGAGAGDTVATGPQPPLTDVKNDPKYQDVYGLLITEGPWWSWGAAAIGGTVGAAVCIFTAGIPCLVGAGSATTWAAAGSTALAVGAGTAGGSIIGSMYQMKNQEDVGKLPDWQSDWKGCFNLCGDNADGNDMLTMKVLRPVLGGTDRYCIRKDLYYTLHNITTDEPVFFSKEQADKIYALLPTIADQGFCDYHFNDADAYIVKYNVDSVYANESGKQELNYTINIASEPVRIDD